jgi:hypothetical protein
MKYITESHILDSNGNPAGGTTIGLGIASTGGTKEPNGAFVEGVIEAAIGRLRFYQESKFACRQNAIALTKLEEALHWCQDRTAERIGRGVEGTHQL